MDHQFIDGRLFLQRTPEEKEKLLQRLRRIEGQVRGLQQMIEDNRYCLEEVQQVNAVAAAIREVALLVIQDHLTAAVEFAVEAQDGEAAIKEMITVLRAAMR
jgi:CsoR family transcriptional regulator, copper-sensing transcriptional repressor